MISPVGVKGQPSPLSPSLTHRIFPDDRLLPKRWSWRLTTLKTNSISARSRAARTSKFPRVWQGPRVPQDLRGSGHGSSALIASASFASPSCLERIMSKEVAPRRDLRNSSSNVVKPTIFVPGSMPRSTDAASTPFILGMLRSRITRAGARSLAFSMAATPSSASQQALKGVALSMKLQMAPRTAALSSTTRIHGVRGDPIAEKLLAFTVEGNTNFRCFS